MEDLGTGLQQNNSPSAKLPSATPPKTNMEPENGPLEKDPNIYKPLISGLHVGFRGCKLSNITASQLICHPAMRHCHQDRPWRTGSAEPLRQSRPSRHRSRTGSASGRVEVKEGKIGDPLGDPNFWERKIHKINDERWSVCNFLYQCMVSLDSCS